MSNLTKIVDSLENSIGRLLKKQTEIEQANQQLEKEIDVLRTQKQHLEEEIVALGEKCRSLQLANSLLGSDQYKRETKLKINALIREIDQCIVQLSE